MAAREKSLLLSRQFFVQAVAGLLHYPKGIGLGSFGDISLNPEFHVWGMSDFSLVVHNLVLEIMSGVGWLGLVFVVWLAEVVRGVLGGRKDKMLVYRAMWLSLTINFINQ